jgi:hypothetical protein
MKDIIFNTYKYDKDFIQCFKENNNNSLKGYIPFFKDIIRFYSENFNFYLDKKYLDISYLIIDKKILDIDLLFSIFQNNIKEGLKNYDLYI